MLYDDPLRFWPYFAAALGIAVGGSGGMMAAMATGDVWRYGATFAFLAITTSVLVWKLRLLKTDR